MTYPISHALPGSVVSVPVHVGPVRVDHVGILGPYAVQGSERVVYSNSRRRGRAIAEPVSRFSEGAKITLLRQPPASMATFIVRRAQALVRSRKAWNLFDNCEHFVSRAYGETPFSPQLRGYMVGGLGVLGLLAVAVLMVRTSR